MKRTLGSLRLADELEHKNQRGKHDGYPYDCLRIQLYAFLVSVKVTDKTCSALRHVCLFFFCHDYHLRAIYLSLKCALVSAFFSSHCSLPYWVNSYPSKSTCHHLLRCFLR